MQKAIEKKKTKLIEGVFSEVMSSPPPTQGKSQRYRYVKTTRTTAGLMDRLHAFECIDFIRHTMYFDLGSSD